MKRSGFGPRKKPMSRGSWKSSPVDQADWRAEIRANPKRSTLKSKPKRVTVAEGAKYLAACRGEPCFARIAGVCCGDWSTVVPAHSNQSRHGKGMGLKADHIFTTPMCLTCHQWTDQGNATREEKFALWDRAYAEWEPVRARKMGITQPEMEEV
jgi:hypothetical protein